MAYSSLDKVMVSTSGTPGTGNLTLASAFPLFQTIDTAGGSAGQQLSYSIEEGTTLFEYGKGTYLGSGVFQRDTVLGGSSGAGVKVNFTGVGTIFIISLLAEDVSALEKRAAAKAFAYSLIMGA